MGYIFLFGHRQEHGKDVTCDILEEKLKEKNISHCRTSFAKKLKKQVAERYGLNYYKMNDQAYKATKPQHLNGRSVRDVLLHEGKQAREIWLDVWAWAAYEEIFKSKSEVGFVSDFRFPNEYDSFDNLYDLYIDSNSLSKYLPKPKVVKVQIYRPAGVFKNDGADGELPDDFDYWDHNIINEDVENWRDNLYEAVDNLMLEYL